MKTGVYSGIFPIYIQFLTYELEWGEGKINDLDKKMNTFFA